MAKALTRPMAEKLFKDAVDDLLPFIGGEFPNLANHTPGRIVDMVGQWKVLEKELKKYIDLMNSVIDSKLTDPASLKEGEEPPTKATGDVYEMKLVPVTQVRLNGDKAKAELSAIGKLKDCQDTLEFNQHKYSEK